MESSGRSPFAGNFKRLRTKLQKALAGKTRSTEKGLMQVSLLERDPEKQRAHNTTTRIMIIPIALDQALRDVPVPGLGGGGFGLGLLPQGLGYRV